MQKVLPKFWTILGKFRHCCTTLQIISLVLWLPTHHYLEISEVWAEFLAAIPVDLREAMQ